MKKLLFIMTFASCLALNGCCNTEQATPKPLTIDNALTDAEKAEGRLTAEVMWKMSRIGAQTLSPDGSKLLYTLTQYNLAENRGITTLHLRDMATGEERQLTDNTSSNHSPQWLSNTEIAFLSNRTGSSQVWALDLATEQVRQLTNLDKDVEGFGIAGDHAFYVQRVKVDNEAIFVGSKYHFEVSVNVDNLSPEDIGVELLLASQIDRGQDVKIADKVELSVVSVEGSKVTYAVDALMEHTGSYDVALRGFPKNPNLPYRMDFALVKWA